MKPRFADIYTTLVLFLLWQPAFATETTNSDISIECSATKYQGKLFSEVYISAQAAAKVLCNKALQAKVNGVDIDNHSIGEALKELATTSEKAMNKLNMSQSASYGEQFIQLNSTFEVFNFNHAKLAEFKAENSLGGTREGYFEPLENEPERFEINETSQCGQISPGNSCAQVFADFGKAFNSYRAPYNNIYNNTEQLATLGKNWDEFLLVSKSQTVLEVFLTTQFNSSHFKKDHLVGPPSYQVIALHPQLVYDTMSKAPDGSHSEMGLAVEWMGINCWDCQLPLGLSISSVYVDRPNVSDVGHGLMLHINNSYAVGWAKDWTKHNGVESFYVTIDLLKLFDEKKAKYDTYMKNSILKN